MARRTPTRRELLMFGAGAAGAAVAISFNHAYLSSLIVLIGVLFGFAVALLVIAAVLPDTHASARFNRGAAGRVLAWVRDAWFTGRSAPWRGGEGILDAGRRRVAAAAWHAEAHHKPIAYSHLHVRLHPESVRAMTAFMDRDLAARTLVGDYSTGSASRGRYSEHVELTLVADPRVPIGRVRLDGAFCRPEVPAEGWVVSSASAALLGEYLHRRSDAGETRIL